jgi:hypothetical protein
MAWCHSSSTRAPRPLQPRVARQEQPEPGGAVVIRRGRVREGTGKRFPVMIAMTPGSGPTGIAGPALLVLVLIGVTVSEEAFTT